MFIELTAAAVNQKWIINIKNITFVLPNKDRTTIFFMGDNLPLDVKEDYETVKRMIINARL